MDGMPSLADAQERARELLGPLGDRWTHVQGVAARATELVPVAQSIEERHLLVVAARWHDRGYSPALRVLGVDRARASELLGASWGDTEPGQQLITVIRKGSRALQQLPATSGLARGGIAVAPAHLAAPRGLDLFRTETELPG
jgi:hypothetical protein